MSNRRATYLVLAQALCLAVAAERVAAEPSSTVLRQLTYVTVGDVEPPKMQMQDAEMVAFVSDGDVLGLGTSTVQRQIYLWTDSPDGIGTLLQITNGTDCESYDVTRPTDTTSAGGRPLILAFMSTCDLDPGVGNGDGNAEVFFYEIESAVFHQITDTQPPVVNAEPFVSDSGRCVVFRSNGNLQNNSESHPFYDPEHPGPGYTNPDGSDEIFIYSKIESQPNYPYNAVFTQISNGPAGTTSSHPVVGGYYFPRQCQTSAYQSDHDQLGNGNVGQFIYMYRMPASAIEEFVHSEEIPLGVPPGIYRNPFISSPSPFARGPHIVFESEPDLWNNGSVGTNIFDYRVFHPRMTQYSNVDENSVVKRPTVADGGGVIALDSNAEILNQKHPSRFGQEPPYNPDKNFEIFRFKGRRRATQITYSENCDNTHTSLKDDGRRIAFLSTCDLVPGSNPTGMPQIFLWGLERHHSPLLVPGVCEEANGCCMYTRQTGATCYTPIVGKKAKPPRPNCLDKPQGCH
jgi:hypothetical protein